MPGDAASGPAPHEPVAEPPERVWYAAYGSNCDAERLATYLQGGVLPATGSDHAGSADPAAPRADAAWTFDRALRFAGHSPAWGGATALLTDDAGCALGRIWLLSWRQLEDVFAQENGVPHRRLTEAEAHRHATVWDRPYGRLLRVGVHAGRPVITFTAPQPSEQPAAAPSAAYLRTLVRGLLAVHRLEAAEVAERLSAAAGIADASDRSSLYQLAVEAGAG